MSRRRPGRAPARPRAGCHPRPHAIPGCHGPRPWGRGVPVFHLAHAPAGGRM